MNWFTLGGALLHLLKNAPQLVDAIEQLFDAARGANRAPTPIWQAVTSHIEEVRRNNAANDTAAGKGGTPTG